jgi:hypothetical protein
MVLATGGWQIRNSFQRHRISLALSPKIPLINPDSHIYDLALANCRVEVRVHPPGRAPRCEIVLFHWLVIPLIDQSAKKWSKRKGGGIIETRK